MSHIFQGVYRYDYVHTFSNTPFGTIVLVKEKETDHLWVARCYPLSLISQTPLGRTIQTGHITQSKVCHPYVPEIKETFRTQNHLCIMVPFINGITLERYLEQSMFDTGTRGLGESDAIAIFKQILKIVDRFHRKEIAHRYLNLKNLLIEYGTHEIHLFNCKLSRFGGGTATTRSIGDPEYWSPELIEGDPQYNGLVADVFSLGVIYSKLICGQHPFYHVGDEDLSSAERVEEIQQRILHEAYDPENHGDLSVASRNLLKLMLCHNVIDRITVAELLDNPPFKDA